MNHHRVTGRHGGRRLFCCLFCALILILWTAPAGCEAEARSINASENQNHSIAVDPIEDDEGYFATLYDNRNGLPTSEANAIAQ